MLICNILQLALNMTSSLTVRVTLLHYIASRLILSSTIGVYPAFSMPQQCVGVWGQINSIFAYLLCYRLPSILTSRLVLDLYKGLKPTAPSLVSYNDMEFAAIESQPLGGSTSGSPIPPCYIHDIVRDYQSIGNEVEVQSSRNWGRSMYTNSCSSDHMADTKFHIVANTRKNYGTVTQHGRNRSVQGSCKDKGKLRSDYEQDVTGYDNI